MSSRNLKLVGAYLKPKQINQLKELKEAIEKEHGVSLSVSQMIRDAIDDFIGTTKNGGLDTYLEYKGW